MENSTTSGTVSAGTAVPIGICVAFSVIEILIAIALIISRRVSCNWSSLIEGNSNLGIEGAAGGSVVYPRSYNRQHSRSELSVVATSDRPCRHSSYPERLKRMQKSFSLPTSPSMATISDASLADMGVRRPVVFTLE